MTPTPVKLTLADLEACFEGVIPSIISTADADGLPNISYLSHVAMVDGRHVALSNQFFAKTAANIRLNPHAMLLLVDARNSAQYRLQLVFAHTLETGPLFEHIALQLDASSAQVGMAGVMKLRNLDVFRVASIEAILPGPDRRTPEAQAEPVDRSCQDCRGDRRGSGCGRHHRCHAGRIAHRIRLRARLVAAAL